MASPVVVTHLIITMCLYSPAVDTYLLTIRTRIVFNVVYFAFLFVVKTWPITVLINIHNRRETERDGAWTETDRDRERNRETERQRERERQKDREIDR